MSVTIVDISEKINIDNIQVNNELISSKNIFRSFDSSNDIVELHVYSPDGSLISSEYDYKNYRIPSDIKNENGIINQIELNPAKDLENLGFSFGKYIIQYNILRKKIINSSAYSFYISEISQDRTELRLTTSLLEESDLENSALSFIYEFENSPFFKEFLLNFGSNNFETAINIALDKNSSPYTLLVKLFNPLPEQFNINDQLWVQESLSFPYKYEVDIFPDFEELKPLKLKSPNFNINLEDSIIKSSDYYNIDNIFSFNSLSSYQNLLNKIKNNDIRINVDYSSFESFIHYSSATERLYNFRYKLSLIESYQNDINNLSLIPGYTSSLSVSSSVYTIQNNINNIIQGFDGYESYLYFESTSFTWPKNNSQKPYTLYPVNSNDALTWFGSYDSLSSYYGGMIFSSSVYDLENIDRLVYIVPQYIRDNDQNESFILFLDMIGQHFDNIWLYIKGMSDIYKANNHIDRGISKDLVYYALKSLGLKIYNSESDTNIFEYFIGSDNNANFSPMSSSYSELVSASNDSLSGDIRYKEILKRIYHNVPLLLKSKGTNRALKSLITTFGIPSTLLDVFEYGGSDKSNKTIEYTFDRFTYSLIATGSYNIRVLWSPLTQNQHKFGLFNITADTIEFRFKPNNSYTTQSLIQVNSNNSLLFGVRLQYSSSNGLPFGNINFVLSGSDGFISSSTISLPIWVTESYSGDNQWWNIMLKRRYPNRPTNLLDEEQYYDIYVKNEIGGRIGHQGSSSLYIGSGSGSYNYSWMNYGTTSSYNNLYLGGSGSSILGTNFQGNLQEFRLWSNSLLEDSFNFHVLNPESYEGNNSKSAFDDLAFRLPLGNNLLVFNHSLTGSLYSTHPNQSLPYSSGSFFGGTLYGSAIYGEDIYGSTDGSGSIIQNSNSASLSGFSNNINYENFEEKYYCNVPNSVYNNPVTEKIRIIENSITGSVLKHDMRLENTTDNITVDSNVLEISFSPQNEINRDIIAQFGDKFNIDDYIGNPSDLNKDKYNDLDNFKEEYFIKYFRSYNYKDYVRLIDFYNNSLFKMIEDFIPARSSVNTGVTFKNNILERNKIKINNLKTDENIITSSIRSGQIQEDRYNISNNDDLRDNYTGEYSGSSINLFETGNFNPYALENKIHFEQSDFNVLLNNVSCSRFSHITKVLDNNNFNISYSAEHQDSYKDYKRHTNPRYLGSRSTSLKYNFYTPPEGLIRERIPGRVDVYTETPGYSGDRSYDKTAAIDIYSRKFAFFSEIVMTGSTMPSRSYAYIKYLIDEYGNTTELTQQNNNIDEIQRLFKTLTDVDVSLMDNQNPTYQKSLDGLKTIYAGGYRYSPILFNDQYNPSSSLLFEGSQQQIYSYIGRGGFAAGGFDTYNISSSAQVGQLDYNYDYTGSPTFFNEDPGFYTESLNTYNVPANGVYDIVAKFDFRASGSNSIFSPNPGTAFMTLKVNVDGTNYESSDYVQGNIISFSKPSGSCLIQLNNISLSAGSKISASIFLTSFYKPGTISGNSFGVQNSSAGVFWVVDPNRTNFIITSNLTSSTSGVFVVDSVDRRYISASDFLTKNYGNLKFKGYSPNYYDDIEYDFQVSPGDIIRFATGSMITNDLEFEISEVILPEDNSPSSQDRLRLRLTNYVPLNVNTDYFALIKKLPDETNIVLRFPKRYGQTSAGILIPGNIDPEIKRNISNIVGPLKDTLLSKVLIIGR